MTKLTFSEESDDLKLNSETVVKRECYLFYLSLRIVPFHRNKKYLNIYKFIDFLHK